MEYMKHKLILGPPFDDSNTKLRDFILNPDVDILKLETDYIPITWDFNDLPFGKAHCPDTSTLIAERDLDTGDITGFKEVEIEASGCDARTSMSLQRAPGPPGEATMGNAMNYPFWPGGFDLEKDLVSIKSDFKVDFENNLLCRAPGFTDGLDFGPDGLLLDGGISKKSNTTLDQKSGSLTEDKVDLLALVQEENLLGLWKDEKINTTPPILNTFDIPQQAELEDPVLKILNNTPTLNISEAKPLAQKVQTEWAEKIDISQPVNDFHELIPDPAHTYPFELDTFQKQAILKLEEHNHVFVAAHTSAGKTVVAEYAIALSKKHMTRAIYTSPIKALSNQKYRDFTQTFKEVGLITGDIQINSTAPCLIMTTEILKSMLYNGSDVTRDLEYVIFDEVHYINDADRGHVWEEVLILLPQHVCIVMLSATVPNTLEFANWVGQTKRKKVYVISTAKRPVPLQHYLYTGSGGKSKDERFLLVDEKGAWQQSGYNAAVEAKNSRMSTFKKEFGHGQLTQKQEQTMWVGLLDHLKRSDKLPIVAFTLSRNRCDRNAEALSSIDLLNAKEKNRVHMFYQQCLHRLKDPDKLLPQVQTMQSMLERGIGVHHSGILPILKEIVEMCFQDGLVKLLFATETFAMGVNMPARTVIFDSAKKFDGTELRTLLPAEYIQMAGRAGRRGLDPTGTVILVCKSDVPDQTTLTRMMLGKPMRLESQFRLTYAMILNLIRVQSVSVESMMSHSFREFKHLSEAGSLKEKLNETENKILHMEQLSEHLKSLCDFYDTADEYINMFDKVMPILLNQNRPLKALTPGRILLISKAQFYNRLALLLQTRKDFSSFKVLLLSNQEKKNGDEIQLTAKSNSSATSSNDNVANFDEKWHRLLSLSAKCEFFVPEGSPGHEVVDIQQHNIIEITTNNIKIDTDLIIKDWEKRQIPRFRDAPPGQTCTTAVSELAQITSAVNNGTTKLQYISLRQDLQLKSDDVLFWLKSIDDLKSKLEKQKSATDIANFEEQFIQVFQRRELEYRKKKLSYNLSYESMSLYPDYKNKLAVLRSMKYIDDNDKVEIKGRVACEMGSNELIITEIVFRNTLKDLPPAEIAALLSCLVFQAKTKITPTLIDSLKKGIKEIEAIDADVANIENANGVGVQDVSVATDKLNFGLVQVVYEWARDKPFADIMQLTDVQEGIIVRCIQQLNETIRDVKDAARIIGDPVLSQKMDEASNAIKRDIVFAASLYTQQENISIRAD